MFLEGSKKVSLNFRLNYKTKAPVVTNIGQVVYTNAVTFVLILSLKFLLSMNQIFKQKKNKQYEQSVSWAKIRML